MEPNDLNVCLHSSDDPERFGGAASPPLFGNSLFVFPSFREYTAARKREYEEYVYWRGTNPTVEVAERKLALLEQGEACKCFASGMAAIAAAILSAVKTGDHVVCVSHVYEETKQWLQYMTKFGVSYTVTRSTSTADIVKELRPETKVIFMESPSSFLFRLVDLKAVAKLARERGIRTIVDNTWATPLYQKPLRLGIDMVVHSASKYLGGHSDLVGGAVIGRESELRRLFESEYLLFGAAMAPYEAQLLIKGLRTLPLRLPRHGQTAKKLARALELHPAVAAVHYPGLKSHPDYKLGMEQMAGTTGLFSFELKEASFEAVARTIDALKRFRIGCSWGAFESLVLSPNDGHNEKKLRDEGLSPGLIRLSVGLEEPDVLIRDLMEALEGRRAPNP